MSIKKIPSIKKNIEAFLTSEEGKISKKSVLKLGMGVTMLGTMLAQTTSAAHVSYFKNESGHGGFQQSTPS